jgi:hypothetical protein
MKRFFLTIAVLAGLAALAVFVLPALVPQSILVRHLAPLLADATGLELERAERLRLSVYPAPAIAFEGVSARLPVAGERAPIIRAERILAEFRGSALMDGRLELSRVVFEGPSSEIHLGAIQQGELDDAGTLIRKAGYLFAEDAPSLILAASQGKRHRAIALPQVEIGILGGAMTIRDDAGRAVTLSGADLTLTSPGGADPVHVQGGFLLQDEPVAVKATATPEDRAFRTQVALTSHAGETSVEGTVVLQEEPHFSGAMRVVLTSGAALARMIGGEPQAFSRFEGGELLARLSISEERLDLKDGVLSGPGIRGNLAIAAEFAGPVQASLQNLTLHGGRGQGLLNFDRQDGKGVLGASLTLTDVDALALGAGASGFDWLSGRANTDVQLAASGRNLLEVASTLKGTAKISVTKGAIEGVDLPEMVEQAKAGDLGGFRREAGKRTPFELMQANYLIEKGVATTEDIKVAGPNIDVTGAGRTDFTRQKLKYKLNAKVVARPGPQADGAPQAEPDAFVMPLVVKGDWDRPDIYPDFEGAMKDKEALRGTAKLFGKSVEKLTGGGVKSDEFGKMIDGLFGKKKKKKDDETGQGEAEN